MIASAVLNTSFESIMGQIMILIDDQRDELRKKGLDDKLKVRVSVERIAIWPPFSVSYNDEIMVFARCAI